MSSRETNLKEKFRIALNSTAKVISEDFDPNNKNTEDNKSKNSLTIEIEFFLLSIMIKSLPKPFIL